jgi:hypothetical protein
VGERKSHGFFNRYNFEHYRSPSKTPLEYREFFHGASFLSSRVAREIIT